MSFRAGLTAFVFLAAATAPAFARDKPEAPISCEVPLDAPSHPITRTPRLGLSFFQDGAPAPLEMVRTGQRQPSATISTVRLRRGPFEVRLPVTSWSAEAPDVGLAVSASEEPCTERLLRLNESAEDNPLFGRFRAMADYPHGAGRLISARGGDGNDYGYNYIVDDRFNASGEGYRGAFVARIDRRFGDEDLMQGQAPITLVFYLNQRLGSPPVVQGQFGEEDVIDVRETDVVRIVFVD